MNDDLSEILKQSYKLYPRVALFTDINKFPYLTKQVATKSVGDRLLRIFRYWGKNVGSSILRSSFVTHVEAERPLTYNQRREYALKMRTSTEQMLLSYKKILDAPALLDGNIIIKAPTKEEYEESKSKKTYENQLKSNKAFYNGNKVEILRKQKIYKNGLDEKVKARKKILYFLNNDESYLTKIKKTTLEKYDLKLVDGIWV